MTVINNCSPTLADDSQGTFLWAICNHYIGNCLLMQMQSEYAHPWYQQAGCAAGYKYVI